MIALASGTWKAFYAATLLDGSAGAAQHWAGEVERYSALSSHTGRREMDRFLRRVHPGLVRRWQSSMGLAR